MSKKNKKIICIGTSTGGPRALQTVLTQLPKNISAPIVIVQHMPPAFTKSLANRLDLICKISVKEAENGEILHNGTAYIAPGGKHLTVLKTGNRLIANITEQPPVNGHRPSVDVLFESISQINQFAKIAVIMTGMGADGAKGLEQMKQSGKTYAIAESEASCIVYGMPRAAVNTGMVDSIVELQQIADHILKYIE